MINESIKQVLWKYVKIFYDFVKHKRANLMQMLQTSHIINLHKNILELLEIYPMRLLNAKQHIFSPYFQKKKLNRSVKCTNKLKTQSFFSSSIFDNNSKFLHNLCSIMQKFLIQKYIKHSLISPLEKYFHVILRLLLELHKKLFYLIFFFILFYLSTNSFSIKQTSFTKFYLKIWKRWKVCLQKMFMKTILHEMLSLDHLCKSCESNDKKFAFFSILFYIEFLSSCSTNILNDQANDW
jgi:hypothetical protein